MLGLCLVFRSRILAVFPDFGACYYLAELLSVYVRYEGSQALEPGVYTLHPPPLVAIGNHTAQLLLAIQGRFGGVTKNKNNTVVYHII